MNAKKETLRVMVKAVDNPKHETRACDMCGMGALLCTNPCKTAQVHYESIKLLEVLSVEMLELLKEVHGHIQEGTVFGLGDAMDKINHILDKAERRQG